MQLCWLMPQEGGHSTVHAAVLADATGGGHSTVHAAVLADLVAQLYNEGLPHLGNRLPM